MNRDTCYDEYDFLKYVEDYTCTSDISAKEEREATKSFFSGHSSFSFFCATFLIVFLQARLSGRTKLDQYRSNCSTDRNIQLGNVSRVWRISFRGLRIMRPFLQFGAFMLAFYICLTRIMDYKHHPTDVLAGAIVGVVFAIIFLRFIIKIFDNPVAFSYRADEVTYIEDEPNRNKYNEKVTKGNSGPSDDPFTLKQVFLDK